MTKDTLSLALIGLGTVGTGVWKRLNDVQYTRSRLAIEHVAVQDVTKPRSVILPESVHLTDNPLALAQDPSVDVLIELMGGITLAYEVVRTALSSGKHVVTANKALIATHGPELFQLAREKQVSLLFEGAVAGGIPIVLPLKVCLAANRIQRIAGILNGTTNFILTMMAEAGWEFDAALRLAQEKGFAEADPTSDVSGEDTAFKLSILASLACGQWVDPKQLHCEGITQITALDIRLARELGYCIKLLGVADFGITEASPKVDARVHPMLLPLSHPLAGIQREYNGVWVCGDAVGDVMFSGRGAGEMPTASAVCADVLMLTESLLASNQPLSGMQTSYQGVAALMPLAETRSKFYIRLNTSDTPGVMGQLGQACGQAGVSLESVMQKGSNQDGSASIVLITHEVLESQMAQALATIQAQQTTQAVACLLRVLA